MSVRLSAAITGDSPSRSRRRSSDLSMSVFGQSALFTAGTGGFSIGWNAQNARCSGVMMYFFAVGFAAGGDLTADLSAAPEAAADADVVDTAGIPHWAPARTQATSASISSGSRRPPFGILRRPV